MQFWVIQTLNSLALGGLLFLLSSGFSLIFGTMRIANLTHGALYMLGAYFGVSILARVPNLWLAALLGGLAVAALGGLFERLILRRLAGNEPGAPPRRARALLVLCLSIGAAVAGAWYLHAAAIHRIHPVPGAMVLDGWVDPAELGSLVGAESLDGLGYLQRLRDGTLPDAPAITATGAKLVEIEPGHAVVHFEPGVVHCNALRQVHGGVISTLLDTAIGQIRAIRIKAGSDAAVVDRALDDFRSAMLEPDAPAPDLSALPEAAGLWQATHSPVQQRVAHELILADPLADLHAYHGRALVVSAANDALPRCQTKRSSHSRTSKPAALARSQRSFSSP